MQSHSSHDPAETLDSPQRTQGQGQGRTQGLDLFPTTIIALGCPTAPTERLMNLQSGVAKLIEFLTTFRPSRPRLLSRRHAVRPLARR